MKDLVIFDCDGVLVDSEIITNDVAVEFFNKAGFSISTEDALHRFLGKSDARMCAEMEAEMGKSLPADFLKQLHEATLQALSQNLKMIEGVKDVLGSFTCKKCVASSSVPEKILNSLNQVGLISFFFQDSIFSATMVKRSKPAPDLFLFSAERMNVEPSKCVVIEDSLSGVQAAVAAGMDVIGFTGGSHLKNWPEHREKLRQAGALSICTHMRDLAQYLAPFGVL